MKDKTTAGLLALFLGTFGAHKFYLGQSGAGCGYLFLSVLFPPVPLLLGFIEGLQLLSMPQELFDAHFNAPPAVNVVNLTIGSPGPPLGQPVGARATAPAEPWYQRVVPRTRAEQEQVLLAMIADHEGSATPAEVALQTQLSLQQARDLLHELEMMGACQTEYDPDSGLARYLFPELQRPRATGTESAVEDSLGQSLL